MIDLLRRVAPEFRKTKAIPPISPLYSGLGGLCQRPRWLTHRGFPNREHDDSRRHGALGHAISGEIARGLFGRGDSGVGPAVEGRQSEPAASVAGRCPGLDGSRIGGADRRDRSPDVAWLGRFNASGPEDLFDNWTALSLACRRSNCPSSRPSSRPGRIVRRTGSCAGGGSTSSASSPSSLASTFTSARSENCSRSSASPT